MKDSKPTKKELASQTKALEEQLTRLKNRLNGQVFKKTKHGYRLDQLSEGAMQMGRRITELEQQLAKLGSAQRDLAAKWQELGRDSASTEPKSQKEGEGKKKLKEQLLKLKTNVSDLSQLQQQIGNTLNKLQQDVGRVADVRDDLKLETDQLRSQIRNLEENSSRLSISQSAQETRTRELEDLLAELTLKLEKLSSAKQAPTDQASSDNSDQTDTHQQLQHQLDEHTTKDEGRHKEVDRRLQELANRIGDLGGHFNFIRQELADQRQYRDQLKQDLDLRLQQLESRVSGIDELEAQLGASLKKESSDLWQKLEEKNQDLDKLRERLDILSNNEQGPDLNQKLSGVEAEINRLSEAENFLHESFQGLGGFELNLTSRLDDIQQQFQEHIAHTREFEETIRRLSGELGNRSDNLQSLLEQAETRQQGRFEALEQKQELLTEQELNLDSHRQEIEGQLDRIEESINTERERISQLEQNYARISDENASHLLELEQARALQLELQSRFEDLNEDFNNQNEQHYRLTTRVDEQTEQLRSLASNTEEQYGQLTTQIEAQTGQLKSLSGMTEEQNGLLTGLVEAHTGKLQSLTSKIDEQNSRLTAEIEAHTGQFQSLTGRIDEQAAQHSAQVKESKTNVRTNQIGLLALALFTLLGGGALYFANKGKIAEVEQRFTEKLTAPDIRYLTREDFTQKLATLESGLSSNSEKIARISAQPTQQGLLERQSQLEQQLDELAKKLNLLAVPAQQNINKSSDQIKPQHQEMEQLQLEISRIDSVLSQLTKQSLAGSGDERLAAVQNNLNEAVSQLDGRVSQLESRPDPSLERITKIEEALSGTNSMLEAEADRFNQLNSSIGKIERNLRETNLAVEKRLQSLETDSAGMAETVTQMQGQIASLAASPSTPKTANLITPTAEWQQAVHSRGYAIQLAGSRSKQSLAVFAARQAIQEKTTFAQTVHEGRDWFILLYGPFAKFKEASEALESLPVELTRYSPWIRRIPSDAQLLNQ